ncbi:MAG TPA: Trm112 family protein [Terracidiphilus sp.]|nr:Trm112 family protein [Terracidiphilus sp.]
MPKPTQQSTFDATVVSQLACPACLGDLRLAETRLVCAGCGRGYPVVDGIPVLIAERAETDETRGDNKE